MYSPVYVRKRRLVASIFVIAVHRPMDYRIVVACSSSFRKRNSFNERDESAVPLHSYIRKSDTNGRGP